MLFKRNNEDSTLKTQIDAVLSRMDSYQPEEPQYQELLATLERLYKLENHNPVGFKPSADAVLAAVASIGGILLITKYEKLDTLASKAVSFIVKPKM